MASGCRIQVWHGRFAVHPFARQDAKNSRARPSCFSYTSSSAKTQSSERIACILLAIPAAHPVGFVSLTSKQKTSFCCDLSQIDNSSETCPACHSELSSAQVRAGWSSDPNDYTTECRALVDLHAATPGTVAAAGMGWADAGNDKGTIGGGGGATAIASAASSTTWSGTTFESSKPAVRKRSYGSCGRRFVSRFSVHSSAVGWEGTTGAVSSGGG